VDERHADLARSLQDVAESVYFHVLRHTAKAGEGSARLALAGGCANNLGGQRQDPDRNAVPGAVRRLRRATRARPWSRSPASGAPSAAPRKPDHAALGPEPSRATILEALQAAHLEYAWWTIRSSRAGARSSCGGHVLAVPRARRVGPRALGNSRSRRPPARRHARELNARIKHGRFRPSRRSPGTATTPSTSAPHPVPLMNQVIRCDPASAR
jgi:predicted NodU family carbamoyl transferase